MTRELQVSDYIEIQTELNNLVDPEWKKNLNHADFSVAIYSEIAELLDSSSWKWWKKQGANDTWNMKIELTDIFHFYISQMILNDITECDKFTQPIPTNSKPFCINEDGSLNRGMFSFYIKNILAHNAQWIDMKQMFVSFGMTDNVEISGLYVAKATLNEIRQNTGYKVGDYKKYVDGVEDNVRLQYIVDEFVNNDTLDLDDVKKSVYEEFLIYKV